MELSSLFVIKTRRSYYIKYSAVFAFFAILTFGLAYFAPGKSMMWIVDTLAQPYTFFVYEGMWLRGIVEGIITGGGLNIPVWDMSLGYGADIIPTLGLVFANPFNFCSMFCPVAYSEYLYNALIIARVWCAGLAFSHFTLNHGVGYRSTLLATIVYCFSATALVVVWWPGGVEPMILFPLVLAGVDRVFKESKAGSFIVWLSVFLLIDFSFAYDCCLLLLGYCTICVFKHEAKVTLRRFLQWVARFIAYIAVSLFIAAVLLVPTLMPLLGTDRLQADHAVPLLYDIEYYVGILYGFMTVQNIGSDCHIGYNCAAILGLLMLFMQKRKMRTQKTCFVILTVFLLLPFAGHVFNGFNYVTNRWVWAYAFLVAFIFAEMVPSLVSADKKQVKTLFICCGVYVVLALALVLCFVSFRNFKFFTLIEIVILLATLVAFALTAPESRMRKISLCVCVGASAFALGSYFLGFLGLGGWSTKSMDAGVPERILTQDSPADIASHIDDEGLWRYDTDSFEYDPATRNTSIVEDVNGIDYYWSFYNNDIDRYHTELALNGTYVNFCYYNLDGRSILERLASVKYYLSYSDTNQIAPPYGYDMTVGAGAAQNVAYTVRTGNATLPLAYTYKKLVPRSLYDSLTPIERQKALLAGVVLDDDASLASSDRTLVQEQLALDDVSVPWSVTSSDGVDFEDGVMVADKANATITLSCAGIPDCETYLYLKGFTWVPDNTRDVYCGFVSSAANSHERFKNFEQDSHMYGGKHDWLMNMRYSADAQNSFTISFDFPGTYTYDSIEVICQPMADIDEQIKALGKDVLENIEEGNNRITGNITLDESKYLYLSVPYSTGWKAYVDGVETTVSKANTAFMAIYLTPGYHEVEFVYSTPGLAVGAILSGIGIASFIGILVIQRQRTRRKEGTHQ